MQTRKPKALAYLIVTGILLPSAACAPLAAAVLVHGGVQTATKLDEDATVRRTERARFLLENEHAHSLDWPSDMERQP